MTGGTFFKIRIARFAALPAILLFAACVAAPPPPPPDPFNDALTHRYLALAHHEAEAGRLDNAKYFRDKADEAWRGEAVPDRPRLEAVNAEASQPLNDAYIRLTRALDDGAAHAEPAIAATAQASYDCWLAEQDRRYPLAPLQCQAIFTRSLKAIEAAQAARHAPLTISAVQPVYRVALRRGAAATLAGGADTLDLAAQDYKRFRPEAVYVDLPANARGMCPAVLAALRQRGIPENVLHSRITTMRHINGAAQREQSSATIVIEFST